jgi:Arc/MetJ-type ribon-helix-helix transcriptional regulator
MTDLIKKGVYLRPEQVDILAKLVYESRKKGKRYVSESLIIRAALELLIESNFDILAYQSEGDIVGAIKGLGKLSD